MNSRRNCWINRFEKIRLFNCKEDCGKYLLVGALKHAGILFYSISPNNYEYIRKNGRYPQEFTPEALTENCVWTLLRL